MPGRSHKIVYTGTTKRAPTSNRGTFSLQTQKEKKQPEVMGLINGREPGSSWEWHTALALWALGWDFLYQVPILGGRMLAGGLVLDFLVKTVPVWTAMPVNGPHWHTEKTDEYMERVLIDGLREEGYFVAPEAITLWEEAETFETAKAFIYQKIGRH